MLPVGGDNVWGYGKVTASQAVVAPLTWDSTLEASEIDGSELVVFPNPVSERLWFAGVEGEIKGWEVLDLNGRVCLSGNGQIRFIDVSELENGIYVVKVEVNGGFKVRRFLQG